METKPDVSMEITNATTVSTNQNNFTDEDDKGVALDTELLDIAKDTESTDVSIETEENKKPLTTLEIILKRGIPPVCDGLGKSL